MERAREHRSVLHTAGTYGIIGVCVLRGVVQRTRNQEDKRIVSVTATDSGRLVAEEVFAAVLARLQPMLDILPDTERRQLRNVLNTMNGPEPASEDTAINSQ